MPYASQWEQQERERERDAPKYVLITAKKLNIRLNNAILFTLLQWVPIMATALICPLIDR
jgi:hypothetical protein